MSRNNPYALSVDLNTEDATVDVFVKERESGETIDSHSFAIADVHESLASNVVLYGLSKILQDRSSDVKTGPDKLAAMKEVAEQIKSGQWAKERKVGAPTVSAEVEALAQLKGISIPQAQSALRRYDAEQRQKILANPKIVELAAEIRASREAADDVALDDMLA